MSIGFNNSNRQTQQMVATTITFSVCAQTLRKLHGKLKKKILRECNEILHTRFLNELSYFTVKNLKNPRVKSFYNRHFASRFPEGLDENTRLALTLLINDLLRIQENPETRSLLQCSENILYPFFLEDIPSSRSPSPSALL